MEDKLVRTKKPHICSICGEVIAAGEQAYYYCTRIPVYSNDGYDDSPQVGILYDSGWYHFKDCYEVKKEIENGL